MMVRRWSILALMGGGLLLLAVSTPAQQGVICPEIGLRQMNAKGIENLTISTTAVALTVPAAALMAVAKVEDQPIRYRSDGTAPTSTAGVKAAAADTLILCGRAILSNFKSIRQGATDAALSVEYYGR